MAEPTSTLKDQLQHAQERLQQLTFELKVSEVLDHVRKQALEMHGSDELHQVVAQVFQALKKLELLPDKARTYFCHIDKQECLAEVWMTHADGTVNESSHHTPLNQSESMQRYFQAWIDQVPMLERHYTGHELKRYLDFVASLPHVNSDPGYQQIFKDPPNEIFMTDANFRQGNVGVMSFVPLSEVAKSVLKKFAQVFELTFTRFLDLQRAEAQAREAQIEAALERVRAASMAMHKSKELNRVVATVFDELKGLGFQAVECEIILFDPQSNDCRIWPSNENKQVLPKSYRIPYTRKAFYQFLIQAWKTGTDYHPYELKGRVKSSWEKWLFSQTDWRDVPKAVQESMQGIKLVHLYGATIKHGILEVGGPVQVSDEQFGIVKRFAKVFEQSYTRFLDIKKAEAQAREAQIEAAIERIRTSSMAMSSTGDILKVVTVFFHQLKELDVHFVQAWINVFHLDQGYFDIWFSPLEKVYDEPTHFRMPSALFENTSIKSWRAGSDFSYLSFDSKEELNALFTTCDEVTNSNYFSHFQEILQLERLEFVDANYKYGTVSRSGDVKATREEEQILKRFAQAFEQTYTRFLDLQKSEAQAREAQIEVALERVRSRSMAMQKSQDLNDVISVLFRQFDILGLRPEFAHISLFNEADRSFTVRMTDTSGERVLAEDTVPIDSMPEWEESFRNWKQMDENYVQTIAYAPEVLPYVFSLMQDVLDKMPEAHRIDPGKFPNGMYTVEGHCRFGFLGMNIQRSPTDEEKSIIGHFAREFGRVYQRVLDLERSEAQAREAQIEASLERLRAASMAMHKTEDIDKVLSVFYEQLHALDLDPAFTYVTIYPSSDTWTIRMTDTSGKCVSGEAEVSMDAIPVWRESYEHWKASKEYAVFSIPYTQEELPFVIDLLDDVVSKMDPEYRPKAENYPNGIWSLQGHTPYGWFGVNIEREPTAEDLKIIPRFSREFGRMYRRFLELQKAETQAREAKIEAALERVRAASMAMHHSDDIGNVLSELYHQLKVLKLNPVNTYVINYNTAKDTFRLRITDKAGNSISAEQESTMDPFPVWWESYEHWKASEEYGVFVFHYEQEEIPLLLNTLEAVTSKIAPENMFIPEDYPDGWWTIQGHTPFGWFGMVVESPPTEEEIKITPRFSREFGRMYQRFLDLQKSEAQAREAQIEAALERVRAKTMAMHSSRELSSVVKVIDEQLRSLEIIDEVSSVVYDEYDEESYTFNIWITQIGGNEWLRQYNFPIDAHPNWLAKGQKFFQLKPEERKNHFVLEEYIGESFDLLLNLALEKEGFITDEYEKGVKEGIIPRVWYQCSGLTSHGELVIGSTKPFTEDQAMIIKRFAVVFEQTYTRFRDLQNAEIQAREAQIEASLERVRAAAMAMQRTDDLSHVLSVLFQQFDVLEVDPAFAHLTSFNAEEHTFNLRITDTSGDRNLSEQTLAIDAYPPWEASYYEWQQADQNAVTVIHYPVEVLPSVLSLMQDVISQMPPESTIKASDYPNGLWTVQAYFVLGYLGINVTEAPDQEIKDLISRFAKEFSRVFQRFEDLKKAEEQAREAQIESALEKVRSGTMGMQNSEDLEEVIQLIFDQFSKLDIFVEHTGFIIDYRNREDMHIWLADPNGSPTEITIPYFDSPHWNSFLRAREEGEHLFTNHLDFEEKNRFYQQLFQHISGVSEQVKAHYFQCPGLAISTVLMDNVGLYIENFAGKPYSDEDHGVLKRFGTVFQQAYTRFLDLQKAEAQARLIRGERDRLDAALKDLKATQAQLIHAEKMASLGELTAGIAHEIQNPLNFVNNFSEVSTELAEELSEMMLAGDKEEAEALIADICSNLEKIAFHGRRAEGIVKSMLQHSRTGSGVKESADINALCDEYVRLAYHGMRARDKTFQAQFELRLEPDLPRLEVVPQDIGRVVLNLVNNAFQAVADRKDGKVVVTSSAEDGKVLIKVEDNGPGIPEAIKDKIFQPFFTTKPTGQGTGLGLSLSYDIVKAHGGTIDLRSKADSGTIFTITFPHTKRADE